MGFAPEPAPTGQRWGFGAFLVVQAVFVLSAVFITAAGREFGVDPVTFVLVGAMTPTLLAAATAVLITKLRGNGPFVDLRLEWNWADVKVGFKLGLLGLVLTYVAALTWSRLVGDQNATSAIGELVDGAALPLSAAIAMFCYVCFIGPVCEELIYRGLLWGAIERQGWSRWAAFTLSTAIFAASHLEPIRTVLLIVISLPIGIARLITRRLTASVVAHVVNNFLPGLTMLLIALGVMPA
ncbi:MULTISPECIES: CPBP family intramembrane glutamic endopeptidase [Actinosynnema]|uniref:Abortive infection protein n=1 Tax=Actinosynnema mirum (strain ATCC 29888 / DSM 43827 / JCM 3225 / NBRC 14064 / NCIMB 13271 / NRRL B-12336 / IMRU 3971 / 101) TaxID=446462 RepID=C6WEW1_ACTMD|nr:MULTISPECIES: CPBP family intramembrane glutamic endopeptidase [Actinosynnema]ACU39736.1 Abortive infection protein [Actinosynnema mirum DSM 43827]AXX33246.1 putative conserved integral membrane protein [Actinosynnema pretiosum subsp. pretiosum]MCP2093962.1 hypothetical protein [Actinosynnema pretiosum]